MYLRLKSYFQTIRKLDIGNQLFLYGIFFLPSTSLIGFLLLLFSLIISFKRSKNSFLKDPWHIPLIISIGLIIFSTINIIFLNNPYSFENLDSKIIWVNLLKWIVLIISFVGFQNFLECNKQRKLFAQFLISGTIPLIFSCFLQKFFLDQGPYQILNGLIIWFQKPLHITGGVSGLFSNVNYTGIWLGLTLPFCISLSRTGKNKTDKLILLILIILFSYFIFETTSRNAYLGLMLSFIFLINFRYSIIFLIFQFSIFISTKFLNLREFNFFGINFNLPIISTIADLSSSSIDPDDSRLIIFKEAFFLVKERPFFGWGVSTFNFNFMKNNLNELDILKENPNHTHNMPLELAYNFGIPLAIILVTLTIVLLLISIKKLNRYKFNKEEFLLSKAWILSTLIIITTHLNDVTFYEDRIGILISILFAGLRGFIKDNKLSYFVLKEE
tara:strand:+ start:1516 stop:2844 length:1329 start_codon:yes stop_codon:yes gene_type:complete